VDGLLPTVPVKVAEVRALLVRAVAADVTDPSVAPLVDALCTALLCAAAREQTMPPYVVPTYRTAADAVDGYRRAYVQALARYGRRVEDPADDTTWRAWPPSVPLRDDLPRFVVALAARALAYRASWDA